jgi:hypothetical protein
VKRDAPRTVGQGNTIAGQSGQQVLFGIAFGGDGDRVEGNQLSHLPVGILSIDDPGDGIATTNATILGNSFVDVGQPASP